MHRIEHSSVSNDSILQRIKKDSIVIVLHSYIYEHGDKMIVYGALCQKMMHPNRKLWTYGGAFASFEEKIKGTLEAGKLADLVAQLVRLNVF